MVLYGNFSKQKLNNMYSKSFLILTLALTLFSCQVNDQNTENNSETFQSPSEFLKGDFDNFQQYWKQNTEDAQHKDQSNDRHEHVHIKFISADTISNRYNVEFYTERNNRNKIGSQNWQFQNENDNWTLTIDEDSEIKLSVSEDGFKSEDGLIHISGDTLQISDIPFLNQQTEASYKLVRCRYFDGWLQYPMPDISDSTYSLRNLQIHDQGGMVELDLPNVDYTAELTQLVFAHKIRIMKLAIYDVPMSEVGINSKSISYTWTNPEAKRIGINLRKLISGWTLIEEGYVNSTNLNKKSNSE